MKRGQGSIDWTAFDTAWKWVAESNRSVLVLGKAGTGKTTFIELMKRELNKTMVVLAPTGVAALHAQGQTLHSFFQLKPSLYLPNDFRLRAEPHRRGSLERKIKRYFRLAKYKAQLIRQLDVIVIDEISMVRCEMLDVMDKLLRAYRSCPDQAFGGVQLVMVGDVYQLPPVVMDNEWSQLRQFYPSPFFFASRAFRELKSERIELTKVFRQADQRFVDLLNRLRENQLTSTDWEVIDKRYKPEFKPRKFKDYIVLTSHQQLAEQTNQQELARLEGEAKRFNAQISGFFPQANWPCEPELVVKVGAQVMFLRNDRNKRYHNGKIGRVVSVEDGIVVECTDGVQVQVDKEVWYHLNYQWNAEARQVQEVIIGRFVQYPLRLAWAITVHKSQGLTFDRVILDVGASFAYGQVYVALSRCRSWKGVVLRSRIPPQAVQIDPVVGQFLKGELNWPPLSYADGGEVDSSWEPLRERLKQVSGQVQSQLVQMDGLLLRLAAVTERLGGTGPA